MNATHSTRRRVLPILALAAGVLILLVIVPHGALAADVTLAWDANTESDLEGYGVYFRRGSSDPPYDLFGYVSVDELSNANSPAFTAASGFRRATCTGLSVALKPTSSVAPWT